jgi:hypothetical protein
MQYKTFFFVAYIFFPTGTELVILQFYLIFDVFTLLGSSAVLVGSCLQTFWNTLLVPSSRSQAVKEEHQETLTCPLHSSQTA